MVTRSPRRVVLLIAALLLASACATPIGVNRVDHTVVYRSLSQSVLSGNELSQYTQELLTQRGLEERFDEHPEEVIRYLHGTGTALAPETLFALSEMSFAHGERAQKSEYHLAAAVYALAFFTHPD